VGPMIDSMTSHQRGVAPRSPRRVAGRPGYSGRLTVRSPAPASTPPSFTRSVATAFSWSGWKAVGIVATSLVAISTAVVATATFFVSARTLQANTRQQTNDRFVKAVDQLGSDKPDVQLGGIYGLEQLARDSPADHPAVFDVLTAFVRGHAPIGADKCAKFSTPGQGVIGRLQDLAPSAGIQTVIDALARRDRKNDRRDALLDISNTCLIVANLHGLQLSGISITFADLRISNLEQADLHLADLSQSDLRGVDARSTNFYSARLDFCKLDHGDFSGSDLASATLEGAQSTEATFFDSANLTGANLLLAQLTGAHLEHANLTDSTLTASNLMGAHLEHANLTRAYLGGAHLTGADLTDANLTGADLAANLDMHTVSSANLTGANLSGANLTDIYYDASTQWPNGFQPPPSRLHR
jgi:hypothetical protein